MNSAAMGTTEATAPRFRAGACLRIQGQALDFDAITRGLGNNPTHTHRQGTPNPGGKELYPRDMWMLESPLGEGQAVDSHLTWLAERLLPHKDYISSLKKDLKVDVYCWKTCFTEQANLYISGDALEFLTQLSFPLDVSLIFLPDE